MGKSVFEKFPKNDKNNAAIVLLPHHRLAKKIFYTTWLATH